VPKHNHLVVYFYHSIERSTRYKITDYAISLR
jgi:hypothetical protein